MIYVYNIKAAVIIVYIISNIIKIMFAEQLTKKHND